MLAEDGQRRPLWVGGDTYVVQLGDVLDRGDCEIGARVGVLVSSAEKAPCLEPLQARCAQWCWQLQQCLTAACERVAPGCGQRSFDGILSVSWS